MLATKINIQVLMNIDGRVVDRIMELVEVVRAWVVTLRSLGPRMASSVTVARSNDELLSSRVSNAIDRSLVVLQDE